MSSLLSVCAVGIMPDASLGETAHQQHKNSNKSSNGQDQAGHYIRRANTVFAMAGLTNVVRYKVTKYDRRLKMKVVVEVAAGTGCSRVLQALRQTPAGGAGGPVGLREAGRPTVAASRGQYAGAAQWSGRL